MTIKDFLLERVVPFLNSDFEYLGYKFFLKDKIIRQEHIKSCIREQLLNPDDRYSIKLIIEDRTLIIITIDDYNLNIYGNKQHKEWVEFVSRVNRNYKIEQFLQ